MTQPLTDRHRRTATDLRVSVTDRCNLRCLYCMPEHGPVWIASPRLLTDQEVTRLVAIAVERLGITEVRYTGGEPLLRPTLPELIARTARLTPRPRISLTTNGIGLTTHAGTLRAAGLDRVNISLDTLDPDRFKTLTRRDKLPEVLAAITAAADAGLAPIKLNAVIQRGINEPDILPLLEFALDRGYEMRFIEHMPLGGAGTWTRAGTVTAQEILAIVRTAHTLRPEIGERGTNPAQTWIIDGHQGPGARAARVGIIASVTQPFCAACDRTRLTADGAIRSCLFSHRETDLRTLMRNGADDAQIAEAWADAMHAKPAAHGIDTPGFAPPQRTMSAIGG